MSRVDMVVHPVGDLFPMLPDDDLAELAADIKSRGQLHAIVLDAEGRILDGRNRYAACRIAKVKPQFVTYDGDDPDGYALAVNIARRHLSKGQQAMVVAKACSVSERPARVLAEQAQVSLGRIGQASTVRDHAPDLVDQVIAGALGLDAAYATARERKTAAESLDAQMATLRAKAPDLADLVAEERLTAKDAWATYKERVAEAKRDLDHGHAAAKRIVGNFTADVAAIGVACTVAADLDDADPPQITADMVAALRKALDYLDGLL